MLYLKIFYQKSIRKYGLILVVLFTLILLLVNFSKCIDIQKNMEEDLDIYKTLTFVPKSNWNYVDSITKYENYITEYDLDEESNTCYVLFKERENLKQYLDEYQKNFSKLSIYDFSLDSKYNAIKNVTKCLIILSISIILFIILFFSLNILYNLEKDISLFKLLGFKNKKIILITLSLLYIYYFLMFLISILLARIIYFIFSLNSLKLILGVNNLYILNINNYILLCLIISIFIILSFIRVTYKVIKISPINLIKAE